MDGNLTCPSFTPTFHTRILNVTWLHSPHASNIDIYIIPSQTAGLALLPSVPTPLEGVGSISLNSPSCSLRRHCRSLRLPCDVHAGLH